ncbi:hypothetical protein KKP06_21970 [Ralstonia pickettii]|uniref:hypothetical protein n=1 Tax=Ralstonia pickettii TaxID=329 RepID=UPI001BE4730C|nr:hypothetical protein [Ralstonia pickettii]MBT2180486.1 hypothetical protein [Ralstonia pickettii]
MERGHYLGFAIGAGLIFAGWLWLKKKDTGQLAQDAAAGVVGAVANVAAGAATGTVLGIGDVLGVPRTNLSACEQAKADGRTWDASFACPAGDFLGYVFSSSPSSSPAPVASATPPASIDLMQDPILVNQWGPM